MHVVVVGGGIAGLVAARTLAVEPGLRVTVLESSPRIGGKLRTSSFAGYEVDEGAEQVLVRRPEALELIAETGLSEDVVNPRRSEAAVWSRGRLRPLPAGTVLGVPSSLRALGASGVVTVRGLARAALDQLLPRTSIDADIAVGAYVRSRFGREVTARLVDPLLGGVYAGHADALSLAATMPQLADAARRQRTGLGAARAVRRASPERVGEPVFATLRGGLGSLAEGVVVDSGMEVRTNATVRGLHRTPDGFRVVVGDTRSPEPIDVAAVVLALPAAPAARLLSDVAPMAAAGVRDVDYASMAVVTLAYPRSAVPAFDISGYLVPAVERRTTKAVTLSSMKWAHLDGELSVVRCSIGRYGEVHDLQRDDAEIVAIVVRELEELAGVRGTLVESRVTRWGGGLPQYLPGHLGRVAALRAGLPRGLAVCGAAYDGVGLPACIASGRTAAQTVVGGLRQSTRGGQEREEEGA